MFGKKAPAGVVILAGLVFVAGFWRLLMSCFSLWWSARFFLFPFLANDVRFSVTGAPTPVSLGIDLLCLGVFGLLLAIAWMVLADALLNLQPWAWQLTIILGVINILFAGLEMIVGVLDQARGDFPWGSVVGLVLNGLVVWYLLRSKVKDAFGLATPGADEPSAESKA